MDDLHEFVDGIIANVTDRIDDVYKQALIEMWEKQRDHMAAYQRELEQRERALDPDDAVDVRMFEDWRHRQAYRAGWLRDMIAELTRTIVQADATATRMVADELPTVFAESANRSAYEVDSMVRRDTNFTLMDRDTARILVQGAAKLYPSVDEGKDAAWNSQKLTEAVRQGVLQGEPIPDISRRLLHVVGSDRATAVRVARTSTTCVENMGRTSSYERAKSLGIDLKQEWVATVDSRTRHSHRQVDGERVEIGETFSNGLHYPGDPDGEAEEVYNCRCTIVGVLNGFEDADIERWSRLEDGMTYEQWKHQRSTAPNAQPASIEQLRQNLNDAQQRLDNAVRAQRYGNAEESSKAAKEAVDHYAERLSRYEQYKDVDADAITRQLAEIEARLNELDRRLDALPSYSDGYRQGMEEHRRLQSQVDALYDRLSGYNMYNRWLGRYENALREYNAIVAKLEASGSALSVEDCLRERNAAIRALSEAQPFAPEFRERLGDQYADAMERIVDNAAQSHPEVAAMYRMFSSQFHIVEHELRSGAYYSNVDRGIHVNAQSEATGNSFDRPYQVIFHELGHLIDNQSTYGSRYSSADLTQTIKDDWVAFRNAIGKRDGVTRDKNGHAIDVLRSEMAADSEGSYRYANISDIVEGCTGRRYPLGYGHGAAYHKREGATAREFFAEVCDSAMTNPAAYEQFRRIFPNATDMVVEIARGLTE